MIDEEEWPPNDYPDLNIMEISCPGSDVRSYLHPKPKAVSEFKSHRRRYWTIFATDPVNKAVPSVRNSLTEYIHELKGD